MIPIHREPKVIRGLLQELRSGKLFIVKVTRSGRNAKYPFLILPKGFVERYGKTFRVVQSENYVDYVSDPRGDYHASGSSRNIYKVRFPVNVFGYVVVEPHDWGFRVYY